MIRCTDLQDTKDYILDCAYVINLHCA